MREAITRFLCLMEMAMVMQDIRQATITTNIIIQGTNITRNQKRPIKSLQ